MKSTWTLAALLFLGGCAPRGGGAPSFELEKPVLAFGEAPKVTYEAPVPSVHGQQYWITLVPAGEPDSAWGAYSYLIPGDRQQVLPQPAHGGDWEVRLHDLYPRNAYKVIQRASLRVEGGPASAAAEVQAEETPDAAPAASPVSDLGTPVNFTVETNAATTKFGHVTAATHDMLHMRQAARDGGAFYEQAAQAGRKFLVVQFPATERQQEQVIYEDDKVRLYLPGRLELKSHSAATGGVNSEIARQGGEPTRFETEIWIATINDANAYPFAVAFEVPADSSRAWLKVEDDVVELTY